MSDNDSNSKPQTQEDFTARIKQEDRDTLRKLEREELNKIEREELDKIERETR
jgi:hypothetical protein